MMKKFIKLVLFGICSILLVNTLISCNSYKKLTDIQKERLFVDTDKTLERMDSIFKNGAINDTFTIPIPQANTGDDAKDAALNKELLELVKRLSTQKSSGANSYRVGINDNNELYLKAFIAGTQSVKSIEKKHDSITSVSEVDTNVNSDTKVYVWPWWIWTAIIIAGIYIAIRISMFSNLFVKWIRNKFKKIQNDNN